MTSLQHLLQIWVPIKLSWVLTHLQLPIQDIVFEETEFCEFVISNVKMLVLLKGSRVIFFEDLESWIRVILSFFKNPGQIKSPKSFWVGNKIYIKGKRISSSFRLRIGTHRRRTRGKWRDFRDREREREKFYQLDLTERKELNGLTCIFIPSIVSNHLFSNYVIILLSFSIMKNSTASFSKIPYSEI